jgi:glycosyltransferase involved in cell wall biosynthesis
MPSNQEHHSVLTAVIPVSEPASELTTLVEWVGKIDFRISVVLVVNKKFTDSVELLTNIAGGQKSVRVVEIESVGPGSARELGRKYCKTEFLAFWDCDDLPNYEEVLKNIAGITDLTDVLIGDYTIFDVITHISVNLNTKANIYNVLHTPGIWRMVFRTQSISSLHFPELRMAEDHVFLGKILCSALKIDYVEANFYRYSVGRRRQLSQDSVALSEIPLALNEILELINDDSLCRQNRKFLLISYLNLVLSHAKRINSFSQFSTSLKKLSFCGVRERLLLFEAAANVLFMKISYKRQVR